MHRPLLFLIFVLAIFVSPSVALTVTPIHINTVGDTILFVSSDTPSSIQITGAGITTNLQTLPAGNNTPVIISVSEGSKGAVFISGSTGNDGTISLRQGIKLNVNGGETSAPTQPITTPSETLSQKPSPRPTVSDLSRPVYGISITYILALVLTLLIGGSLVYTLFIRKYD